MAKVGFIRLNQTISLMLKSYSVTLNMKLGFNFQILTVAIKRPEYSGLLFFLN
jgi:hypothetical protein